MPRNRHRIDRELKRGDIVTAAARQVREEGYAGLSVAAIARELGLAPNSIYWYFPSKDELFVAAVQSTIGELLAAKPEPGTDVARELDWFVERLAPLDRLRADLYERSRATGPVSDFVAQLDAEQERVLAAALRGRVPEGELESATRVLLGLINGTAISGMPVADRRDLIAYAFRRLTETA